MTTFLVDVIKFVFHVCPGMLDVNFQSSISTLWRHPCAQRVKLSAGISVIDFLVFLLFQGKFLLVQVSEVSF